MFAVALGLAAASCIAFASFFGGLASRRDSPLAVAFFNFATSVPVVAVLVLLFPAEHVNNSDIAWGVIAGLCQVLALRLLFHALARGIMGVTSAVSAVVAAIVPLLWAITKGEALGPSAIAGAVLAVLAMMTLGLPSTKGASVGGRSVVEAAASGLFLGLGFIALAIPERAASLVPLLVMRTTGGVTSFVILFASRTLVRLKRQSRLPAAAAGCASALGLSLFVWASRRHVIGTVSVLQGLAPIGTSLLAFVLLRQQLRRQHLLALLLACASAVLFALA